MRRKKSYTLFVDRLGTDFENIYALAAVIVIFFISCFELITEFIFGKSISLCSFNSRFGSLSLGLCYIKEAFVAFCKFEDFLFSAIVGNVENILLFHKKLI